MFRKIAALVMAVTILFSSTSIANATTETDPYYLKYGIKYEQLFTLYPEYLTPEFISATLRSVKDDYTGVILSYSQGKTNFAAVTHAISNVFSISGRAAISSMGFTETEEETIRAASARLFMDRLCGVDGSGSEALEDLSDRFSVFNNGYEIGSAAGSVIDSVMGTTNVPEEIFIEDLQTACKHLHDSLVEEVERQLVNDGAHLLTVAGEGIELWQVIVGVLALQDLEIERIVRLRESLPENDGLAADLDLLLNQILQDPIEHIYEKYITEDGIRIIGSTLASFTGKFGAGFVAVLPAIAEMAGLFGKWFFGIQGIEDVVQTTYLSCYASELEAAVSMMQKTFKDKAVSSYPKEIQKYKVLYEAYLTAMQLTAESAVSFTRDSDMKRTLKSDGTLFNTLNYNYYISFSMMELSKDIKDGKVASVEEAMSSGSNAVITPEESHTFIRKKFEQLQEQYPPNEGISFTRTYGGCRGALGFARYAFNMIFDCDMSTTINKNQRYEYFSSNNIVKIGQVASKSAITEVALKDLLSKAVLGDIIQACGAKHHTMLVVAVTNDGITVYDCDRDGNNEIAEYTLSFAEFADIYSTENDESESGVTLYRAANYNTLFWDQTHIFGKERSYFLIEDGVLVKYTGNQSYVVVPDGVISIGEEAFKDNDGIIYLAMPDSVKSIETRAFYDCDGLLLCNFSKNLETVGYYSFGNCDSIAYIGLPDSVTKVDHSAFENCTALSKIDLSNNLTTVGNAAFSGTAITEIFIPKSLVTCDTAWGDGPFQCANLKTVTFEEGVNQIAGGLFAECPGLEEIVIPDTVTSINERAFDSCKNLKRVVLGNKVAAIEKMAFHECSALTEINFPKSLTTLGLSSFYNTALTEIVIPAGVTNIQGLAFDSCDLLQKVSLPNTLTTLGTYAFDGTGLIEIHIPKSLTKCDGFPFGNCEQLKTVTFETGIEEIPANLFEACRGIEEVVIPDTVTKIGENAFYHCTNLKKVVLGKGVTTISHRVFDGCSSLSEINLPEGLTTFGSVPFSGCVSLTEIIIPSSFTTIPRLAFAGCSALEKVVFPKEILSIDDEAFSITDSMTFYGYTNTYAETFATENNIPFVALDDGSDEHPAEHTPAEDWTTDGTYHWKVCSIGDCGETIEETKSQHSATGSNIATCTVKAVCDVCAVSFGDYAAHSYTAQTKNEDTIKAEGNCRDAAEYYYSCSACGDIERSDLHTFAGEKVADAHVGGTCLVNVAPPDHKNQISGYSGDTQCNGCGEILEYGLPVEADEHTPAAAWTTDGEGHWKICGAESCGVLIESTKGAHTSSGENVATCQGRAVCDTCSAPYSEIADHDWATDWSSDVSGHWYICKANGCEETHAFAVHTPDHEGAATEEYAIKCSVCQFEIEPQLNTPVLKNHKVAFIVDGKILDTVTVRHGQDIDLPEIPNKVGYDQIPPHWDHDGKNITEDTEITAVYIINKYIISGTVTGYSCEADTTDDMTIELWAEGASEATYTTTVTGNTAIYSIENVEPSTYTMKVSKAGHVAREYTVVVSDTAVTQDAIICPKGDVNLDGEVNADDLTALARHVAKIEALTDDYSLLSADVDDNGSLSADDLTKLARYVAKIIPSL